VQFQTAVDNTPVLRAAIRFEARDSSFDQRVAPRQLGGQHLRDALCLTLRRAVVRVRSRLGPPLEELEQRFPFE
jgi:hypothetical protein